MTEEYCWLPMEELGKQMEFLRLFKLLNSTLREHIDRNVRVMELTTSQLDVVICLAEHGGGPVSQREIEEELHLSNPTVTGILKRLEKKGFISRRVGAQDRRYREVRLTGKCIQLAERLQPQGRTMLLRAFQGFTMEEFDSLNRMLRRLLDNCQRVEEPDEEPEAAARKGEEVLLLRAPPGDRASGCAR